MIDYLTSSDARKQVFDYLRQKNICIYNDKGNTNVYPTMPLFSYHSLDEYVLENLLNNQITITNPKIFNDIYDSTVHRNSFPNAKKRLDLMAESLVELGMETSKEIFSLDHLEKDYTNRDYHFMRYMTKPVRVKCFTAVDNSILMWSHYADMNRGICIEYDFSKHKHKNMFYPVFYLSEPLDLTELFDTDLKNSNLELGILLSIITKYSIWRYESEWRLVFAIYGGKELPDRTSIINIPDPNSITLGKRFFEHWATEKNDSENLYNNFVSYLIDRNIPLKMMRNKILSYELETVDISPLEIRDPNTFLRKNHSLLY